MTMTAMLGLMAILGGAPLVIPGPSPRTTTPAKPSAGTKPQNVPELPWYTTGFG